MIKRISKSIRTSPKALSPWKASNREFDDTYMDLYCQVTQPSAFNHHDNHLCLKPVGKKNFFFQATSKVQAGKKRSITLSSNCISNQDRDQCFRTFSRLIPGSKKENRLSKKLITASDDHKKHSVPLQEISVKNYVLEGSRYACWRQETKKKVPSYVMKHKFAENKKKNMQKGVLNDFIKFEKQNGSVKKDVLLKLTRYTLN